MRKVFQSPALKYISEEHYPANYRGKIPLKVRVAKEVKPDVPLGIFKLKEEVLQTVCFTDEEYFVWVNSYGAVSAVLENGKTLGLRPSEFDVIEWHEKDLTRA